jgi:ATP-dependent RNA helicase DeaD
MSSSAEPPSGFERFGLSPEVLKAVAELGYVKPTPVQEQTIPQILAGRDVLVQSRTGTGKTAAFGIPIVERIDLGRAVPQALVLCPTRELALQVANEVGALGKHRGVRVFPIYGGASMGAQIDALEAGLHVVVGTPGRLLDHLRSRHLHLGAVRFLVLDEADEMLSMGFYEEVSRILDQVPRERETQLFSATLTPAVEGLVYRHQKEPARIFLSSDSLLVEEVHHAYYVSPSMEKPRNLARILLHEEPRSALIFVNTRDEARLVTGHLKHEGFQVEMLSGELGQRDRERVMAAIKRAELRFMVATDVAARGIDISDLSHVINYAVPEDREMYVHRTGRTGRIGKSGTAITLVGLRELPRWGDIEEMKGLKMEERKLPSDEEILEKQVDSVIFAVRHLETGALPPEGAAVGEAPAPGAPLGEAEAPGVARPPAREPEERYRIAAERILEQGLSTRQLAFLLERALAPSEPEPAEAAAPEAEESRAEEPRPGGERRRRRRRGRGRRA